MTTEGLFRVAAAKSALDNVKSAYDKGLNFAMKKQNAHVIAGALKLWLRELPDSIIPSRQIAVQFAAACLLS